MSWGRNNYNISVFKELETFRNSFDKIFDRFLVVTWHVQIAKLKYLFLLPPNSRFSYVGICVCVPFVLHRERKSLLHVNALLKPVED